MTEQDTSSLAHEGQMPAPRKVVGIDPYNWAARVAPAVLATFPLLTLGALALPLLHDVEKLWSLSSLAVTTFAALAARRAGNRVQPGLINAWGGWPTTDRLRFTSSVSEQEIRRRHEQLQRVLGADLSLPTQAEESADPIAADRVYGDAMKRLIAKVRGNPAFPLVATENRNYGYARNLYGLKTVGQVSAAITLLAASGLIGTTLLTGASLRTGGLTGAAIAAVIALVLWRLVDPDFVRPSADAYADRVVDALDELPTASNGTTETEQEPG